MGAKLPRSEHAESTNVTSVKKNKNRILYEKNQGNVDWLEDILKNLGCGITSETHGIVRQSMSMIKGKI